MKIDVPNTFEVRIKPRDINIRKPWFNSENRSAWQMHIKNRFLEARKHGRLKPFSCMTIDPSFDGKKELVFKKGLPPATNITFKQLNKLLEECNENGQFRLMTETEYVCRTVYIIHRLVESGCDPRKAWWLICGDSSSVGHYANSSHSPCKLEVTGSREICGFCDLGNTHKVLAPDPWKENQNNLVLGSGDFTDMGYASPIACMYNYCEKGYKTYTRIPMLCLL